MRISFQREVVSKILKSLKRLILEQKCQERVKFLGTVFLNLEKGKKLSVLKLSLVLLYGFKQLFSHQSSFPHIAISFFFFFCYRINTRWLNTAEQWTLSVKRSGEMRNSLCHFLFC